MSAQFDHHATSYRSEVDRAIAFAGKDVGHFARRKADLLVELAGDARSADILDVGCGIGLVDAHLVGRFRSVSGVDLSEAELEQARAAYPDVAYLRSDPGRIPHPDGAFDVTFASCVLHHVAPEDRAEIVAEMGRVTRPGGLVVVVEHNPFNPLTRLVVSRISFDEGVELLRAREVMRLYRRAGTLAEPRVRNITFFPSDGRFARSAERALGWLPLGAQYLVSARRNAS